jgi:hypothetical protein
VYICVVESIENKGEVIKNQHSEMKILENSILHISYTAGVVLEAKDIKELQVQFELLNPKPRKVLQELGSSLNMSSEARRYAAEHSPDLIAVAYVIKGLAQRLLIRFHVKMWKRDKPVKVFDSFDDAKAWLMSM